MTEPNAGRHLGLLGATAIGVGAIVGGGILALALIAVPTAGLLALAWLGLGLFLSISVFASRARVVDAASAAHDPELVQLRGRRTLVLVPVANPARAEALMEKVFGKLVLRLARETSYGLILISRRG